MFHVFRLFLATISSRFSFLFYTIDVLHQHAAENSRVVKVKICTLAVSLELFFSIT